MTRTVPFAALSLAATLALGCPGPGVPECEPCQVIGTNYGGGEVRITLEVAADTALVMTSPGIGQFELDEAVEYANPLNEHLWRFDNHQSYLEDLGHTLHLWATFSWQPQEVPQSCPAFDGGVALVVDMTLTPAEGDGDDWEGGLTVELQWGGGTPANLDGAGVVVEDLGAVHRGVVEFPTHDLEPLVDCLGGLVPDDATVRLEWDLDPAVSADACEAFDGYCY